MRRPEAEQEQRSAADKLMRAQEAADRRKARELEEAAEQSFNRTLGCSDPCWSDLACPAFLRFGVLGPSRLQLPR